MDKNLLEYIFLHVSDECIPMLRLTCRYFRNIIDGTFWMNKIIHKFPVLKYKLDVKNNNYKQRYLELLEVFREPNLHYISAMAQYHNDKNILTILSSYKNFTHAKEEFIKYDNVLHSKFYVNPDERLEGRYIEYYKNGIIKEISFYKNGVKNGFVLFKNKDRTIKEIGNYFEGNRHGIFMYFEDEKIDIKCQYRKGLLNGYFKSYIDGKIFEHRSFFENIQHGKYLQYYDNGNLKKEGIFVNGMKNGIWKHYDETGNLLKKEDYNFGQNNLVDL